MTTQNDLYERWIEALESGNYAKTRNCLHDTQGYCCLGVVTHLLYPDSWEYDDQEWLFTTTDQYNDRSKTFLTNDLVIQLNLRTSDGSFFTDDLSKSLYQKVTSLPGGVVDTTSLTHINDWTYDFNLIIEVLKERPASLFATTQE